MIDEVRTVVVEESCSNGLPQPRLAIRRCQGVWIRPIWCVTPHRIGLVAETGYGWKLALRACEHSLPLRP